MYEILFQYGPVTIATFHLFLAIAFVTGMVVLVRYIHLKKMKLSFLMNYLAWFLVLPLVAGRVVYIAEHHKLFLQLPSQVIKVWDMNFSPFGILYGFFITLFLLTRREREDFWGWLDAFTVTGLAGIFFTNIGHFFNGSNYGKPTDLPWAVAFDTITIPFVNPIHPTQLYAALAALVIFSLAIRKSKRTYLPGVIGSVAIMAYALIAFGIDFLHGSPSAYEKVSLLIIGGAAFLGYIHCSHKTILENGKTKPN